MIDAAVANGLYVIVDWHAHRSYPEEAAQFLTAIARKYGHLPNLIYEPFNEPLRDGVDWTRDVRPYHLAVIGAVRAVDRDNLVIAGSPSWSQDVDAAADDPLPFANLAYTLHYYAATHGQELRDVGWMAWSIGDRDETSAALRPGTPPAGWSEDDLTESGRLLRRKLRAAAGCNPACQPETPGIR